MKELTIRIRKTLLIKVVITICLVLLSLATSNAGGVDIILMGISPLEPVAQGSVVELCYRSESYIFSGRRNEYIYIVFALGPQIELQDSVGRDGENNPNDVRLIQKTLKALNIYHGKVNGIKDKKLISAIEKFQKDYPNQTIDGRVDKNGETIRVLKVEMLDRFFIKLVKKIGAPEDRYGIKNCVNFIAPVKVANYDILYNRFCLIVDYPIGIQVAKEGKTVTVLNASEERLIKRHLLYNLYQTKKLDALKVIPKEANVPNLFTTYIEINGKFPGIGFKINSGHSENPLKFSWHTKPNSNKVEYRYRLYPDDSSWSAWDSTLKEKEYYFIGAGSHIFEVAARYKNELGKWKNLPIASYDFTLERAFVSKPIMVRKARSGIVTNKPLPNLKNLYPKSKALLIGITDFQDSRFQPLPYIENDLKKMESVLKKLGFEVSILKGKKTKREVLFKMEEIIEKAEKNDRIIIYFSTHGFQHETVRSKGYIVTYDCLHKSPLSGCIGMGDIEILTQHSVQKEIKHLLIILDSCSSGLGIISKSLEYPEIRIALKSGAHMITAGMADQEAQIDRRLQMSTFTHFFVEGISGKADFTSDNIISLTELLLYVRYNVAKQTDGSKTPMMGRLSGAGEMIFDLR